MLEIGYRSLIIAALFAHSDPVGATVNQGGPAEQSSNSIAISIFFLFVVSTLAITWWAARRTKSSETFYTAGGGISPWQNALAIAGDFMSAATLLGITGLMFFTGYDAYILSFSIIMGWALMLMVIAERFRNLGRFTLVDVVSFRLEGQRIRLLMTICSLTVIVFYLIGQMVGAGKLIELLFGIDYTYAVVIVSVLMVVYVTFGGMIATTWVQMIKALLLLLGGAFISVALLLHFDFNFTEMLEAGARLHDDGPAISEPGGWLQNSPLNVLTVGLTMCFGIMGLPHILMRFFTVKDAIDARKSIAYATLIMSAFYIFILIIGFGAIAVLWNNPVYYNADGSLAGGSNMVALHVAREMGGELLFGFMSAVAFATILAVVAGLTLAGAAAVAHDLYAVILKKGKADPDKELKLSRIVVIVTGVVGILLGLLFEEQNIAVVVAFALSVAASVNFPILLLSMYWSGMTSKGALKGGVATLLLTLILILLGDSVWVQIFGNEEAIFPYIYPTVFAMPVGFVSIWIFSLQDRSTQGKREKEQFLDQYIRSETGIGISDASPH